MAITRHSSFDKTVNTIADRNALTNKVNHMTVVVKDAIADPSAGAGKAIYRWDATDSTWIMVSKSTYETISFITEELMIVNGEVQLSNYPVDNKVWNAVILSGELIYADLNVNTVTVSNSKITGIDSSFNGYKLRLTYAYGSVAVQIGTAITDAVNNAVSNITVNNSNVDLTAVSTDILPVNNSVLNIGSPTNRFKGIYVDEAYLAIHTLYLGDTPILGTSQDTVNIHADPGQSISIRTTGAGTSTTLTSDSKVQLSTDGMNADVTLQASGSGSKVRIGAAQSVDINSQLNAQSDVSISGNLTVTGNLITNGTSITVNSTNVQVKDNIIDLNYGEIGDGVTAGTSGLRVMRGGLSSAQLIWDESDDKFKIGLSGTTLETIATREYVAANAYTLPIASSSTLGGVKAGANITIDANGVISSTATGSTSTTLVNYATIGVYGTTAVPAQGTYIPFVSYCLGTLPTARKVDNYTYTLKAGMTYRIEGKTVQIGGATSGILSAVLNFFDASTGASLAASGSGVYHTYYGAMSSSAYRVFDIDYYITPIVDTNMKLLASSQTLVGSTGYEIDIQITEYGSSDVKLANFTINGKKFDANNNVDLEGLSTLSNLSTTEILTENRALSGKPIYRKVFTGNFANPAVDLTINTGLQSIIDFGYIKDFYIIMNDGSINNSAGTYYSSTASECRFFFNKSTGNIGMYISDNASNMAGVPYQVIIEYTKTSDTASSPVRLVGSGNGTANIVNELPAMTGNEGKYLNINPITGLLEWKRKYFLTKTNSTATNYVYNTYTNMIIDSVIAGDNECSATGTNGGFLIPENGTYSIGCDYFVSAATHVNVQEVHILVYVNNVFKKRFMRVATAGASNKSMDFSADFKLNSGDVVTFQCWIWSLSPTTNCNLSVPANSFTFTITSK